MSTTLRAPKTRSPRAPTGRLVTAEELLRLCRDDVTRELLKGRVVEVPSSTGRHSGIAANILFELQAHVRRTGAGRCTTADGAFVLFRNPDTVRVPDAAFMAMDRLVDGRLPDSFIEGAPDLAVEVVSPSNSRREVEGKAREYLRAGARLVWVIYPKERSAKVFRADGTMEPVEESGVLSGEDVLPGFEMPLADVFE